MNTQSILAELREALLGDAGYEEVEAIAERVVAEGIDVLAAIDVASEAMDEFGVMFASFEVFLPELMIAGEKMKHCMAILQPHVKASGSSEIGGRVVLGTVSGDVHDIGKNLVATMLAVGGFEVSDLGTDVSPLEFIKAAREHKANILALSSLMTNSLPYQKEVIDLLNELGLRDKYYVIVGGGPVTSEFAQEIGADGWASNAAQAAGLCKEILLSGNAPSVATILVE